MTKRILVITVVMTTLIGFTLLAGNSLRGRWSSEITFEQGNVNPFKSLDSVLDLDYSFGNFLSTSKSEFALFGFIWQGFGVTGTFGAFGIQGDILFGPSTADYIYSQVIVSISIAGIDFGLYYANLGDDVLQGAADGFAVRLAGSVGTFDIISITEMGAQIEDKDDNNFNGITIYHASTGLHKHYITNPLVVGQGFTGEKATVSGWSFGCVGDIATTLYITCAGFDYAKFSLSGIDLGFSLLVFDIELKFQLQTKSFVLTPQLNFGDAACIKVYAAVLTDAPVGADTTNTIFGNYSSLTGIGLYGLSLVYSWDGVTVQDLTVLDTGHYAITTEEYGSVIEDKADALKYGHDFYPDYWEMFSIEVTGDGCCSGSYSFLANMYFDKNTTNLFGWGMTHIEAQFPISSNFFLTAEVEVDDDTPGLNHFGLGMNVSW